MREKVYDERGSRPNHYESRVWGSKMGCTVIDRSSKRVFEAELRYPVQGPAFDCRKKMSIRARRGTKCIRKTQNDLTGLNALRDILRPIKQPKRNTRSYFFLSQLSNFVTKTTEQAKTLSGG